MEPTNQAAKTVKVQRWSGRPVDEANIALYDAEWKTAFDKIMKKHQVGEPDATGHVGYDMLAVQKTLARVEKRLGKKYSATADWELLATPEQWIEKINQYGTIMVGKLKDADDICYIIMDVELG